MRWLNWHTKIVYHIRKSSSVDCRSNFRKSHDSHSSVRNRSRVCLDPIDWKPWPGNQFCLTYSVSRSVATGPMDSGFFEFVMEGEEEANAQV